jgi:hypothetical protein
MAATRLEVLKQFPDSMGAVQCVFTSEDGDVEVRYYEGNFDGPTMNNDIKSFVYINNWMVTVRNVAHDQHQREMVLNPG